MSLLNSLFNRGLLGARCKTCLNLAISRIKLLRNKREAQLKQMRKEIAQFLQTGQEAIARIRVEHIIREQNILAAYEILELFCEFVLARVPILETKRECPPELQEAIASIIFAAPRCSDLPELMTVQNIFGTKYGKEFISAISELRPGTSVNREIIEKLAARAPSPDHKLMILKDICLEHNLDWDSSLTEAEFSKKHEDLLDVSKQSFNQVTEPSSPKPKNSDGVSLPENRFTARTNQNQILNNNFSSNKIEPSESSSANKELQNDHLINQDLSSKRSDILEKARAAIAHADRAAASARAASELVKNRLNFQTQIEKPF